MTDDIERQLLSAFEQQQNGQWSKAEQGFLSVLAADKANIHALNLLGINYLEQERFDEAVGMLSKAAQIAPKDAETLNSLGLALAKSGNAQEAVKQFQNAIKVTGPNPHILGNLGAALVECGRAEDSLKPLSQAMRHSAPPAQLLANLAKAFAALGRYEEARPIAEKAVQQEPDFPEIQNILGDILLKQGRPLEARKCFKRSLELRQGQIGTTANLATTYKEAGDIERAKGLLDDLAHSHPTVPEPHFDLGVLAEQLGEAQGALAHFEQAIIVDPSFAKAYYQAAQLKGVELPATLKTEITELLDKSDTSDEDRMLLHFALGTLLEREGDYAGGIAQFRQAHDQLRDTYDPSATAQMHARQRAVFTGSAPATPPSRLNVGPRPLFVLGMPRSGTSLAEQILSAHPQIEGAGESSFLTDCSNEAARLANQPFPECAQHLSAQQLARIGQNYRDRLFTARENAGWVIDKTPLNFQLIGFARAILPDARFIHCQRDPLNTCLSIYKIPFDQNQNYAASFSSLGDFYGAYRKLMQFWQDSAEQDLMSLQYEALVVDVEQESRRVLGWLGLDFDPGVLKFHEQRRLVRTPSATQVNQPIYRNSLSHAEKYGDRLDALKHALTDCYG